MLLHIFLFAIGAELVERATAISALHFYLTHGFSQEVSPNCSDALVTSIINCGTSFFAGFVIFSTLGYMSEITNRPVSDVVGDHDASLIFIVYPHAIATMSYSNYWSGIEALITGFCDEYPRILARKREIFVAIVIATYYFGSLPTVTYGGTYVIPFLDEYGVSLSVLFIVMCEMVAMFAKCSDSILDSTGGCAGHVVPSLSLSTIFLLSVYHTSIQPMSIPSYTYPQWSVPLGWLLRLTSVLSVPIYAIYYLCNAEGTFLQ
uniref:Amino acid transporter transmembrane domain-containing protein n=1 Tax=Parascaris equorum TaxID=6256 RepID=A0A914RVS8_PAREQ